MLPDLFSSAYEYTFLITLCVRYIFTLFTSLRIWRTALLHYIISKCHNCRRHSSSSFFKIIRRCRRPVCSSPTMCCRFLRQMSHLRPRIPFCMHASFGKMHIFILSFSISIVLLFSTIDSMHCEFLYINII